MRCDSAYLFALVAGAEALRHNDRWWRKRRDQEHMADAAQQIVAKLRPLRTVVAKSRDLGVESAEVVEAWRVCATTIAENQHRLPTSWRHLRQSIRAGLGELFGGPSWADISYGGELEEVAEFDGRWWDYALSYWEYVIDRLARVADRPEVAGEAELLDSTPGLPPRIATGS
jgi:hypothetical protein